MTRRHAIGSGGFRKLSLPDPLRDIAGRDELEMNSKRTAKPLDHSVIRLSKSIPTSGIWPSSTSRCSSLTRRGSEACRTGKARTLTRWKRNGPGGDTGARGVDCIGRTPATVRSPGTRGANGGEVVTGWRLRKSGSRIRGSCRVESGRLEDLYTLKDEVQLSGPYRPWLARC